MPSVSKKQQKYLLHRYGAAWVRRHHYLNSSKDLPEYVDDKKREKKSEDDHRSLEEVALHHAILSNPEERTNHLAYADLLQEQGKEAHAGIIRKAIRKSYRFCTTSNIHLDTGERIHKNSNFYINDAGVIGIHIPAGEVTLRYAHYTNNANEYKDIGNKLLKEGAHIYDPEHTMKYLNPTTENKSLEVDRDEAIQYVKAEPSYRFPPISGDSKDQSNKAGRESNRSDPDLEFRVHSHPDSPARGYHNTPALKDFLTRKTSSGHNFGHQLNSSLVNHLTRKAQEGKTHEITLTPEHVTEVSKRLGVKPDESTHKWIGSKFRFGTDSFGRGGLSHFFPPGTHKDAKPMDKKASDEYPPADIFNYEKKSFTLDDLIIWHEAAAKLHREHANYIADLCGE